MGIPQRVVAGQLVVSGYALGRARDLPDIAEVIVSVGTVKNHVSSIPGKLGVRGRTRAVLKGLQDGLL